MPLDFQKNNVSPGEPVTADGWNAIVDGLFEVEQVLKAAGGMVRVTVSNPAFPTAAGRVVAFRAGAAPAQAIAPISPSTEWIFPRLEPATWTVRAEAPGFTALEATVTVAGNGTVTPQPVQLAPVASTAVMPNVLGKKLPAALAALGAIQLRIVDALGKDLPSTGFSADYNDQPIIMQFPDPGAFVLPASNFLVVAAVVKQETLVLVPNLSGMTFAEATVALHNVGLNIRLEP
jgi:hypothetical protein